MAQVNFRIDDTMKCSLRIPFVSGDSRLVNER